MLTLAASKALCQIRPWWPPQHCWPPWSGWQVHSSAHGSTITSNEADSVLPSAAAVFTASVADLFLFKFLPSPEPRGTVPGRKVLRFCGNINSVLLHITCHPGGLWLISTYFSSLGPALIQMASGTPDHRPAIQPNPVSTSEIWVLYLHVIVNAVWFLSSFILKIFKFFYVIFDSKYCIWIYININIRQKYDVCSL